MRAKGDRRASEKKIRLRGEQDLANVKVVVENVKKERRRGEEKAALQDRFETCIDDTKKDWGVKRYW